MSEKKIKSDRDVENFFIENSQNREEDNELLNIDLQNPWDESAVELLSYDIGNEVEVPFNQSDFEVYLNDGQDNLINGVYDDYLRENLRGFSHDHNYLNDVSS